MEAFADCVFSECENKRLWGKCLARLQPCAGVLFFGNKHDVCVMFLLLQPTWNNCKFVRTKKEKSPRIMKALKAHRLFPKH